MMIYYMLLQNCFSYIFIITISRSQSSSMGEDGRSYQKQQEEEQELPQLLVLRSTPFFTSFQDEFTKRFRVLKAWESRLSTDTFLETQAHAVKAMLCSGTGPVTAAVLRHLPALQLIVTVSTGVNHIELPECRRRGITVTNAGTVYAEDVADVAVGLLINVLRRITAADRFVRGGLWPNAGEYPLGSKLGGKRVGIVGLGNIGSEVAKRLEAFGCIISYTSRKKKPCVSHYPFYPNVCELASDCDVLMICCALNDQTRYMINNEVMSALGKNGVIVNIGRGAIIDEKELVRCLVQGEIAGAGLDVFENEPNVPQELFALNNVVMLPHIAAFTEKSFLDSYQLIMANLEAFFSNRPLLYPIITDD